MLAKKTRFIVITGSIMSGLGKGIVTSSIAKLLEVRGFKVVPIKFDGYLNVDCGTMNPFRHGEVFVLDDGTEVDMDFGTYERFLNKSLSGMCSITGGKLFQRIIEKERKGEYLGRDVQFVPHLTDEIKNWVQNVGKENDADVVLVEVGGTVGDMENSYFIESMRQLYFEKHNMVFVQLTYVPSLSSGEPKTKPTQQATRLLQSLGIQPNIILTREQEKLSEESRKKISLYCSVPEEAVFDDPMVGTVYELPLVLEKQNLYKQLARQLELDPNKEPDLKEWQRRVSHIIEPKGTPLKIAIVGKYTAVKDAYISVKEALVHSAAAVNCGLDVCWVEASELEKVADISSALKQYDGIIVPGGFGTRGIEGKIKAIQYARENKVPYLGLCLGLQLMVVEYARNICGMKDANSTEFDKKTKYPVIDMLPEQQQISRMGGTMRLGAYECMISKNTIAHTAYKKEKVEERHRHRYEVNPEYVKQLTEKGLVISAIHPKNNIVEIAEWKESFGVATQAHIEWKSRLEEPAPIFVEFMKAAKTRAGQ
ncbi:CTP synthase [Candidatus Bilamarchaeum dharawalense]|uniref:CTP synthase n=1 Tax=Candidatus Bilamarchaeum dharawalense TaxID=2885759 RepID=A0A5E4LTW9_9ARCH|nr:CTP synthase [Candidatus Bilamarchaeum dharawalense]